MMIQGSNIQQVMLIKLRVEVNMEGSTKFVTVQARHHSSHLYIVALALVSWWIGRSYLKNMAWSGVPHFTHHPPCILLYFCTFEVLDLKYFGLVSQPAPISNFCTLVLFQVLEILWPGLVSHPASISSFCAGLLSRWLAASLLL